MTVGGDERDAVTRVSGRVTNCKPGNVTPIMERAHRRERRAIHRRLEDRLAVREHHGHPGAGLLPEDRLRSRCGTHPRRRRDQEVRRLGFSRRASQARACPAGHRVRGRNVAVIACAVGHVHPRAVLSWFRAWAPSIPTIVHSTGTRSTSCAAARWRVRGRIVVDVEFCSPARVRAR